MRIPFCRVLVFFVLATPFVNTFCLAEEPTEQLDQVRKPVYRIPLRVHLDGSSRPQVEWIPILEEINSIWLSQAGICFEIEIVDHDVKRTSGLDIWFESNIPQWNGYYRDEHDIHVRDDPDLHPATHPARFSAARTAAHELGHALKLRHRQNSDDNLMRSKTFGWQLHSDEIIKARIAAKALTVGDTSPEHCGSVEISKEN